MSIKEALIGVFSDDPINWLKWGMVIGQVQHISVDKKFAQGYERRYGKDGFMMLVPAPQDLVTGEPNQSAIATINIEKYD